MNLPPSVRAIWLDIVRALALRKTVNKSTSRAIAAYEFSSNIEGLREMVRQWSK